ncbi:hypothetical protein HMPREF9990_09325 [Staphylococcus epidermidis NIHLM061]|nr:hypothetical protein HMPREF9990_09325 [Staphylococcus epidermidis NIHLM061]
MSQASLIYSMLYNNSTVGFGAPTQRISVRKFHRQGKLGFGAPTQRISVQNSTDKVSWGSGPQHREFQYEIPRTRQVGVLE